MSTCVKTVSVTKGFDTVFRCPRRTTTHSKAKKQEWLEEYSQYMLGQWLRWQSPFGVAHAYAERIKEDIAEFYDDPLKRTFIEATYASHVSHDRVVF